jgi:hypothetical protein
MGIPWKISVDLDGVLCKSCPIEKYPVAEPIKENIEKCNKLYDMGHFIQIYTARSWAKYDLTIDWLKKHGVKFHILVLGKLLCHASIDDRNYTFDEIIERLSK